MCVDFAHPLADRKRAESRSGDRWRHDKFDRNASVRRRGERGAGAGELATRVLVANLHYDVSDAELKVRRIREVC